MQLLSTEDTRVGRLFLPIKRVKVLYSTLLRVQLENTRSDVQDHGYEYLDIARRLQRGGTERTSRILDTTGGSIHNTNNGTMPHPSPRGRTGLGNEIWQRRSGDERHVPVSDIDVTQVHAGTSSSESYIELGNMALTLRRNS